MTDSSGGVADDADTTEDGSGVQGKPTDDGLVDVDRRRQIVERHYDGVDEEDARVIAETLRAHLEVGSDLSQFEATNRIVDRTDLARDRVSEILWTERASVRHADTIADYHDSSVISGVSIHGGEDCDSPVCEQTQRDVEDRGGTVTPAKLKSILRKHAEANADGGATPARVDHWVPHHKCKAVIRSHIG